MRVARAISILAILCVAVTARAEGPAVGDLAPDFTLKASDGKTYTLSEFRGKQAVVVAWYPKAYTSGCTVECNGDNACEHTKLGCGGGACTASCIDGPKPALECADSCDCQPCP